MSVDVATRLAEGAAAVRAIETYVAASHAVGRALESPTVAGVREAYTAEAGMRLDALEADSAELAGLARAVEEGVRLEGGVLEALLRDWQGSAGNAAAEFVEQHLAGGKAVAASLRAASGALQSLREELGSLVDAKVSAVLRFDDRWAAAHPAWLAEAEVVLNGLADDVAIEVVAQQISPYVDRHVRADWMPAMRDATDSVATAYDGAVARLADHPVAQFHSPATGSAAGPMTETVWAPSPSPAAPQWGSAAAPQWGSAAAPQWGSAAAPQWGSAAAPQWGSAAAPQWGSAAAPQWGSAAAPQWSQSTSGVPSGIPPGALGIGGVGGGLPTLIGRIAEVLGSYSGPTNLANAEELTIPKALEAEKEIPDGSPETDSDEDSAQDTGEVEPFLEQPLPPAPATPTMPTTPTLPTLPLVPPVEASPVGGNPVSQSLPTQPIVPLQTTPPPSAPLAAESGSGPAAGDARSAPEPKTPCSIAMDELPQVGQ